MLVERYQVAAYSQRWTASLEKNTMGTKTAEMGVETMMQEVVVASRQPFRSREGK